MTKSTGKQRAYVVTRTGRSQITGVSGLFHYKTGASKLSSAYLAETGRPLARIMRVRRERLIYKTKDSSQAVRVCAKSHSRSRGEPVASAKSAVFNCARPHQCASR